MSLELDVKRNNLLREINYNKLEDFFDHFIAFLKDHHAEEYVSLITDLRSSINNSPKPKINLGFQQYYGRDINFPNFNNNFYTIFWDIEELKRVIKKYNIQPKKRMIGDLMNVVDHTQLDPYKLAKVSSYKVLHPVFIVDYEPLNMEILVDGNHRVFSSKDNLFDIIDTYHLNSEQSLECMAGDIFRHLFIAHHNITELYNYYISRVNNKKLLNEILIKI